MADSLLPLNRRIGNRNGVTHGHTIGKNIPTEYNSWKAMRHRCSRPNHPRYALYGGRGIKVCARWQDSFEAFLADMGRKPGPGYSLDRIDVNGNYEPGNVRWADQQTQCRNQRRNRRYMFAGEMRTVAEIRDIAKVETSHLNYHIKQGRTADEAVALIVANRSKLAGHCKNGHEMDDANTYIDPRGHSQCRACRKAANRRHSGRGRVMARDKNFDIFAVDLTKVNPAAFLKSIAEERTPEHMRPDDWDARWQEMIDYCEQPAEITTPT